MSQEKIYVGNGRKIEGKYGAFRSISICLDDLDSKYINTAGNGKRYVGLLISDKQEADQWGKDVSVTLNTYKKESVQAAPVKELGDDLPF